jgi:hypothetical protein
MMPFLLCASNISRIYTAGGLLSEHVPQPFGQQFRLWRLFGRKKNILVLQLAQKEGRMLS